MTHAPIADEATSIDRQHGERLLTALRRDFIGLDTSYRTADGGTRRRIYLDSAATTLMLSVAHATASAFLRHNANTHSRIHFSALAATEAYACARERVLSFVGADPDRYVCLFVGHGATAALNRATHYLRALRPRGGGVLVSAMEHHSNDLPHRRSGPVLRAPLEGTAPAVGAIDVEGFEALLRTRPQYAAVSFASNVTGIVNPVARLTAAARAEGVPILVDACQAIAHLPVCMRTLGEPDALVFAGHKAYAPGAPGVLVIRREIVEAAAPAELGGGMVSHVTTGDYTLARDPAERHEAGTPDVVGAVTLSAALEVLARIGMETIAEHSRALTEHLIETLLAVPNIRLYGATDLARCPRIGVASFNLEGHDHGWVASVLNDYYNIAVRHQCFCAQPYAQSMLAPELWALDIPDDAEAAEREVRRRRGMVRASLAMYSTRAEIDALGEALREIQSGAGSYRGLYRCDDEGEYHHQRFVPPAVFAVPAEIDRLLGTHLPDNASNN